MTKKIKIISFLVIITLFIIPAFTPILAQTENRSFPKNEETLTIPSNFKSKSKEYDLFFSSQNILPKANYIIITNQSLYPYLDTFKNWKITHGYAIEIVNISWISTNYEGIDLAEKIRNFLKEAENNWDINYLLIIGSHQTIPMRYCYPNGYSIRSIKVPTDFYYADLTGEWDADNDGYFGELQDSPDFSAEIHVGRIPFDDPIIVSQFLEKTMTFQNDTRQWKKKSLFLGSFLWLNNYKGHNYTQTDGAALNEKLREDIFIQDDFLQTTMYEKEGLAKSSYVCDFPLNNSNLKSSWSTGYGIVNWAGHGTIQTLQRLVWKKDNGDNIPYTGNDTIEPVTLFSNQKNSNVSDVFYLNDETPSIIFSTGCDNAKIEDKYKKSLAESLLENGAVVFIGSTRDVFGPFNWTSELDGGIETLNYLFFDSFITERNSTAKSLDAAKKKYSKNYMSIGENWWNYQNLYSINIFGDPSISIQEAPETPIIIGPSSVKKDKEATFKFNIIDYQQDTVYLQIEWGDGSNTEWKGPFSSNESITLNHKWSEKKDTIALRARAKDEYGWESEWTTLQITVKKKAFIDYYDFLNIFENKKWDFPLFKTLFEWLN